MSSRSFTRASINIEERLVGLGISLSPFAAPDLLRALGMEGVGGRGFCPPNGDNRAVGGCRRQVHRGKATEDYEPFGKLAIEALTAALLCKR